MKKFFKILGASILSVAIVLSAVFLPSMLNKTSNSMKSANAYVLAQNSFISSNFIGKLNCTTGFDSTQPPLTESGSSQPLYSYSFKFELETFSNGYNLKTYANIHGIDLSSSVPPGSSWSLNSTINYSFRPSGSLEYLNSYTIYNHINTYYSNGQSRNLRFGFYTYASFDGISSSNYHNLDIQYVEIGNSSTYFYDDEPSQDGITNFNYYRFVDSNGFYITVVIPLNSYDSNAFYSYPVFFDYRVYFLNSSAQFNDSEFYKQGLSDGYKNGFVAGETSGYSSGYTAGETSGYSAGYNQGVENANEYTFLALIGAVFDAPINAFTSLFNFEILGFNILSFITSLLTLCVILFILKLIFGGK